MQHSVTKWSNGATKVTLTQKLTKLKQLSNCGSRLSNCGGEKCIEQLWHQRAWTFDMEQLCWQWMGFRIGANVVPDSLLEEKKRSPPLGHCQKILILLIEAELQMDILYLMSLNVSNVFRCSAYVIKCLLTSAGILHCRNSQCIFKCLLCLNKIRTLNKKVVYPNQWIAFINSFNSNTCRYV